LLGAIEKSVGKFFDSELEIQDIVDNVEEAVYALGEPEIASTQIGDKVLDQLAKRNEVAYVRFASVYQEFKTLDDFVDILKNRLKKQNGD
jgi:transcriptional repressor NrdR